MEELERLRESIKQLLVEGRDERLSDLIEDAHPADVSRVIRELPRDDQVRLFRLLSPQHAGEVLSELDDPTVRELVGSLPEVEVSRVLDRMPPEQVVDVVEELSKERADEILELMEEEKSEEVQELLEYREGTAGRLMSPDFVAVREDATVAEAIEHIRKEASGEGAFYLYVVDDHDHFVGRPASPAPGGRRADTDPRHPQRRGRKRPGGHGPGGGRAPRPALQPDPDPRVDVNRRLLGTIGVDDVIDVIREEATEDIQRPGGVAGDETVLDPPRAVFVKRNFWRLINLGTAVLAASVIGLFESSIQTLATLAVFMPIVASMGGIATTQTATVVVRGIALAICPRASCGAFSGRSSGSG